MNIVVVHTVRKVWVTMYVTDDAIKTKVLCDPKSLVHRALHKRHQ